MTYRASKEEFLWREWWLGRERFKGHARDPKLRHLTGAPPKIERDWWRRLEAIVVRLHDYTEPGRKPNDADHDARRDGKPAQLSPHFNVREFDCHDGRNVPRQAYPALRRLAVELLEPMRNVFGPAHVLSGYRPDDYNRRIGGARYSQHIYELTPSSVASDLTFRTGTPRDWANLADQLGAGGVGRYDESGFVHVDNRPGRARWTG